MCSGVPPDFRGIVGTAGLYLDLYDKDCRTKASRLPKTPGGTEQWMTPVVDTQAQPILSHPFSSLCTRVIRGSATCTSKRALGLLHIISAYVAYLYRPCRARLSSSTCGIFGKSFSICSNRPCAESVASNTYCSGTTVCARKRNQLKNETRVSDQVEMSFSRNYKHDNNWCWRKNAFTP
jgi:hypothetical protein